LLHFAYILYVSNVTDVKSQRSIRTRGALVRAGTTLFAERGFHGVAAEEIAAAAGVTRGALYHHFDGKRGLFDAVLAAAMAEVGERLAVAAQGAPTRLAAIERGIHAYLEACSEPPIRQIMLIDGPAVVGWHAWRALDLQNGLGLLRRGLLTAVEAGEIEVSDLDAMTHLLGGALVDAALLVSAEQDAALETRVERSLVRLVRGLRVQAPPAEAPE
jgi:AcrR family transcriptional regulator